MLRYLTVVTWVLFNSNHAFAKTASDTLDFFNGYEEVSKFDRRKKSEGRHLRRLVAPAKGKAPAPPEVAPPPREVPPPPGSPHDIAPPTGHDVPGAAPSRAAEVAPPRNNEAVSARDGQVNAGSRDGEVNVERRGGTNDHLVRFPTNDDVLASIRARPKGYRRSTFMGEPMVTRGGTRVRAVEGGPLRREGALEAPPARTRRGGGNNREGDLLPVVHEEVVQPVESVRDIQLNEPDVNLRSVPGTTKEMRLKRAEESKYADRPNAGDKIGLDLLSDKTFDNIVELKAQQKEMQGAVENLSYLDFEIRITEKLLKLSKREQRIDRKEVDGFKRRGKLPTDEEKILESEANLRAFQERLEKLERIRRKEIRKIRRLDKSIEKLEKERGNQ